MEHVHISNPEDLQMQAGESDDVIQFLQHQAERGDLESQVRSNMMSTGQVVYTYIMHCLSY